MATTEPATGHGDGEEPNRRDFLYIATGAVGAVGVAGLAWPFIDYMNPDASVEALASIEVNIGDLSSGQSMRVMWRGKPVFIRRRTEEEVASARDVSMGDLLDPVARNPNREGEVEATDANRAAEGDESLLVMIGVCTHLGCIPTGQAGDFGGWFCPCHGSHYDTAGRVRVGPAPTNMEIPPFSFASDTTLVIG